mmetsp:Transcript_9934/g.40331  ORF Transcript_9934/g.40331 Transcript_9934/m.40331 type:complete len:142 (-) Transcript_9934:124-549(-)
MSITRVVFAQERAVPHRTNERFAKVVHEYRLATAARQGCATIEALDDDQRRWYHRPDLDTPLSELSEDDQKCLTKFYFEKTGGFPGLELLSQVGIQIESLNRKFPVDIDHDSSVPKHYNASNTPDEFKWSTMQRELAKLLL